MNPLDLNLLPGAASRRHVSACVVLVSLFTYTAPASTALAADGASDAELDTVLVTGKRIGLALDETVESGALGRKTLLDTPFSVTVVDGDDIFRRQANSLGQIFINDPSISSWSPAGTTNWWGPQIRGMGVRNYYVDGAPMVMSWGNELPLEPVESVEALKGLTGFMYGFGAPGGVIKYEFKKPTERPLNTFTLGYRNDGVLSGHVDSGGRLGAEQSLGYRVNVAGEFGEAYTTADVNRSVASLALDYRITDDLLWYANGFYEDSKLEHEPLYFYWDMYPGGALPRPTYDYDNVTVENSYYQTHTVLGSTGLKWQINDRWSGDLKLGYSSKRHLSNKMFGYILNEAGDYEGEAYNFAGLLKSYFSQALLQGQLETGAVRHEVVAGLHYQRITSQWSNEWYWSNDYNGNLYQQQTFRVTRNIDFSLAPISEDSRQTAVFASDTLHFGDHWQAIAGLRYTDYESLDRDYDPSVDSEYTTDALSPTLALIYKPVAHVSVYGSFVESLEPGSRVGDTYANFGELLDATVSKQYEVGAKYEKGKLSFTTAAFRVERAAQIDEFRDGLRYLTQDGLTMYDGLEAIGSLDVTPNLTVGLGATYLDAKIDKVSPDNQELEGNTPAGAAEWQSVGNVEYRFPSINGLSVHGSIRYYDEAYYEDANRVIIPERTLANLGFQYQTAIADHPVLFTGSVNNIFNRKYWEMNQLGEGINGTLSMRVNW